MPTPLVGSRRFLLYDYFSVVSRRFYASDMYIMSQSPPVISELTHFHRLHQHRFVCLLSFIQVSFFFFFHLNYIELVCLKFQDSEI